MSIYQLRLSVLKKRGHFYVVYHPTLLSRVNCHSSHQTTAKGAEPRTGEVWRASSRARRPKEQEGESERPERVSGLPARSPSQPRLTSPRPVPSLPQVLLQVS
ncbi:hypothetical protein ElyMa_003528900 [Elysia marginata]|uniref:Uncharacterized protein n=1 Tax=Elysia marginata TaxID=1093978 RepID=A0AAV4EI11_9GAST|nr:hypothetical protein ElyMa_003528900 [Elysia marginata]